MKEEILVWLHDIKVEILNIEEYFSSTGGKSFSSFSKNTMLKKATERSFEIIGEAVRRILNEDDTIRIRNARKIVNFRNKIAHEYDKLDDETLYNIAVTYLPQLLEDTQKILLQHKP